MQPYVCRNYLIFYAPLAQSGQQLTRLIASEGPSAVQQQQTPIAIGRCRIKAGLFRSERKSVERFQQQGEEGAHCPSFDENSHCFAVADTSVCPNVAGPIVHIWHPSGIDQRIPDLAIARVMHGEYSRCPGQARYWVCRHGSERLPFSTARGSTNSYSRRDSFSISSVAALECKPRQSSSKTAISIRSRNWPSLNCSSRRIPSGRNPRPS